VFVIRQVAAVTIIRSCPCGTGRRSRSVGKTPAISPAPVTIRVPWSRGSGCVDAYNRLRRLPIQNNRRVWIPSVISFRGCRPPAQGPDDDPCRSAGLATDFRYGRSGHCSRPSSFAGPTTTDTGAFPPLHRQTNLLPLPYYMSATDRTYRSHNSRIAPVVSVSTSDVGSRSPGPPLVLSPSSGSFR
jgi:hypothetical protein